MTKFLRKILSEREVEILQHIAEGKVSKQIANELHISKHTVDTHRRNMIEKAGVQSTVELIKYANKEGML